MLLKSWTDTSEIQGLVSTTTIPYDYLVFAVGAEVQTFNIPGVREHACFMKELEDAEKMQRHFMDCTSSLLTIADDVSSPICRS